MRERAVRIELVLWSQGGCYGLFKMEIITSAVDPNTLNLDPDPGFRPNLDPDPGLYYQF